MPASSPPSEPVASGTAPEPEAGPPLIEPRWGLGDAAIGWLIAESMAVVASGLLLGATDNLNRMGQAALDLIGDVTGQDLTATVVPLWMIAILQMFLWFGLLGAPIYAARTKGNGVVRDFGLRCKLIDVPVGIVVGAACQFLLVPVLSYPWLSLLGKDGDDLKEPAQQLADKATDPFSVLLLVLIVVIGAPIVEELFFRGLLQRSIARRWGLARAGVSVVAVAGSSFVFGLTHFEVLQFPALVGFGVVLGVLAVRTGRLGPGIFAHLSFNAVTVIALLTHS